MPKVSVLMPIYKTNETFLKEAIESILNQTYLDFEFLILDDCPQDNREEIVKSYHDKRIVYAKNEKNLGISKSRNKLIDMAKGEYLAIMDHDDIALPLRFEKEVQFLDNYPDVGVVGTWYERFPNLKIKKLFVINHQIERDLMFNCAVLHPSAMIRKSVLLKHNIRYEEKFSPAEDYALWCRLIGKTKFANIPEVLQKYRNYENNTSKIQAQKRQTASSQIHKFLEKEHSDLMQEMIFKKQTLKILGLPVISKINKGGTEKYKILGLFQMRKKEKILMRDASDLPIYIIVFNRLSYLKQMIAFLEEHQLKNIHIIDNCSSYPPLLAYLEKTPYQVHRMKKNYGHMVFFEAPEFKKVRETEYYVLTDPDVIGVEECPKDFMSYFYYILDKYPSFNKVGFSLKTDDLPNISQATPWIKSWEKLFYKHKLNWFKPYLYNSSLDTTFAMYRPQKNWRSKSFYKAVRTGFPYEARHLPWYKDLTKPTKEDIFYSSTDCGSGNWNDVKGVEKVKKALFSKMVDHWWENIFSIKKSEYKKIIRICGLKFTKKYNK